MLLAVSAVQAVVKEGASRLAAMQRRQKMMEAEKEVLQAELEAVLGPAAQVETGSPAGIGGSSGSASRMRSRNHSATQCLSC